jgi:NitT/TauT family transport system substrate-binding protein
MSDAVRFSAEQIETEQYREGRIPMSMMQTRRRFLTTLSAASAAGLVRAPASLAAEGALETTTVRIGKIAAICLAPQYVSEELLRAEGFTDVRYVELPQNAPVNGPDQAIARGEADFTTIEATVLVQAIDRGAPVVVVAGVHVGCYELFAQHNIRQVGELKGKRVAAGDNLPLFSVIAAQVGLDPAKDIDYVSSTDPAVNPLELFAQGKIDAFLGFPPHPQELRARRVGHVLISTAADRPWSQYFCCMLVANREYVRDHPVATKRAMRAILKAADLCATQPERAARMLVDRGFTPRYDYALQTLSDVPYDRWREYDPEDTLRYYALRLYELGIIKSTPQKIIAENTDWRFFDELKREPKG